MAGKTNIGTFVCALDNVKSLLTQERLLTAGTLGQHASMDLQWRDSVEVQALEIEGGKVWALVGENSIRGTIFANFASDTEHIGVALLKKSSFEG